MITEKLNWNPHRAELLKFGRRMPIIFLLASLYLWKAGAVAQGVPHHPLERWWWPAWGFTGSWRQILSIILATVGLIGFVTTHFIPRAGLAVWRFFA